MRDITIDTSWTLFLDRDGVINERLFGDYVKSVAAFQFCEGSVAAIARLSPLFGKIIIVTNQQGIGKGVMAEADLRAIHQYMLAEIHRAGGRIDAIYYCPKLAADVTNRRKPSPAMGLDAQRDFPDIAFAKSIMVGDTTSDLQFGKNIGTFTVHIHPHATHTTHTTLADLTFPNLTTFADYLLQ
ncbi:MAG: HAD-IIIA family hydrolase [Saprospiraceae bacterium]|nr:HAD-IIIA family hydrolase [Saprospiraceae bacterium]MBP7680059.1 HAD-IIIA family hydrolase [Saprospiraceae bacterium]